LDSPPPGGEGPDGQPPKTNRGADRSRTSVRTFWIWVACSCKADFSCADRFLQRLDFAVLFEGFVEQHRIYCFIADRVRLAFLIAHHQFWIHLRYLLCDEAKLWDVFGIELLFVAKGHQLQRQDGFARQTHRLDMAFEPGRGSRRPEAAFVVHKDGRSSGDRRPEDPRNTDRVVNSSAPNADPAGVTGPPEISADGGYLQES
jgi:hypothetical protein